MGILGVASICFLLQQDTGKGQRCVLSEEKNKIDGTIVRIFLKKKRRAIKLGWIHFWISRTFMSTLVKRYEGFVNFQTSPFLSADCQPENGIHLWKEHTEDEA